jgi:hypothetical protein
MQRLSHGVPKVASAWTKPRTPRLTKFADWPGRVVSMLPPVSGDVLVVG